MTEKQKRNLLITIEDEVGIDEWPLPAIVPVVFSQSKKRVELECYFGVYPEVRDLILRHPDDLFSKRTLAELDKILTPYLEKEGYYRPQTGKMRYYRSFVLWDKRKLRADTIGCHSEVLTKAVLRKVKENNTDFDLAELLASGLETVVTVENGQVLSLATVNPHSKGQRLLEVAVYTLPSKRGNGYGKSNVAMLSKILLEKKRGVVYCCSCYNRPSVKIAKALGFEGESRFYAVDAYKI